MTENEIGKIIVDRSLTVHKALGPGLLESTYEACLKFELFDAGLFVESQKALPVVYNEVKLDCGYRIDLLIENKVIIEIKSVEILNDVHMA
jgi:GxxExxY protein